MAFPFQGWRTTMAWFTIARRREMRNREADVLLAAVLGEFDTVRSCSFDFAADRWLVEVADPIGGAVAVRAENLKAFATRRIPRQRASQAAQRAPSGSPHDATETSGPHVPDLASWEHRPDGLASPAARTATSMDGCDHVAFKDQKTWGRGHSPHTLVKSKCLVLQSLGSKV